MAAAIIAIRKRNKARKEAAEAAQLEVEGSFQQAPAAESMRVGEAVEKKEKLPHQARVRELYTRQSTQMAVAVLIGLNFLINVLEKELDPASMFGDSVGLSTGPTKYPAVWSAFEDTFNIIFLIELIVNLYGNWFFPFWRSGWNVFDTIVVANGVINLLRIDLGPLSLLRLLRAFRVFRLFKRVKSLNKIVVAILSAIPGMSNAFIIMTIFMSIYAIVAVELFSTFGVDGDFVSTYETPDGVTHYVNVSLMTERGQPYGTEYYGTFAKSLYTMFQVMTGDSWSEIISRPLMFGWSAAPTAIFYITFVLLMQIILTNVVVAVLLEKMVSDDDDAPPAAALRAGAPSDAAAAEGRGSKAGGVAGKKKKHGRTSAASKEEDPLELLDRYGLGAAEAHALAALPPASEGGWEATGEAAAVGALPAQVASGPLVGAAPTLPPSASSAAHLRLSMRTLDHISALQSQMDGLQLQLQRMEKTINNIDDRSRVHAAATSKSGLPQRV